MSSGIQVLIGNIPTVICAVIGGLLADRGHPWFAAALLLLAYTLAHAIPRKSV